jgi:hypothetical protein
LSVIADLFDGKLGVGQFPAARQPAYKTLISAANRRSRWQRDLTKHPSGPIILFPATLAMFGTVIDAPLSASTNAACVQRALLELSVGTREKLGKLPLPGGMSCGLAEKACLSPKRPVVFECVGTPGVLQSILDGAPFFTRVVVVGVCMQPDTLEPAMGINKEIHLRFVLAYSPLEFRDTLHMIAEGKIDCAPIVSGTVGLEGVDNAFTALKDPEKRAKILIDPSSTATGPVG